MGHGDHGAPLQDMAVQGGSRDLRGVQGAGEEADCGQHEHLQHLQDRAHHRPQPRTGEDLTLSLRLQVATDQPWTSLEQSVSDRTLYFYQMYFLFYSIL